MASHETAPGSNEQKVFAEVRHYYLRVTSQGQTRLTVSTFLTGLTFAAFAALLSTSSIPLSGVSFEQFLLAASALLMSVATLLFLFTAASTYAALLLLANVSPYVAKVLTDDKFTEIDPRDVASLRQAYAVYMQTSHWIPWGLVVVTVSLVVIAWHTNVVVGILTLVTLGFLLLQLRSLVRIAITGVRRRPL